MLEKRGLWSVSTSSVVQMGIGAALYAVFNVIFNVLAIPGAMGVSVRPSVCIPMFFGFVFGPIVGFFTGFIGNIISDAISWGGFWWNWDIGNGLLGLIPGLAYTMYKREELGERKTLVLSAIMAAIGSIIGMAFASLTDIWVSAMTLEAVITTEFIPAGLTDLVNGVILTPILVKAYASARRR